LREWEAREMEGGNNMTFRNITALKSWLDSEIEHTKKRSEEYSSIIGEKIRISEISNESDLADLREKITSPVDPKKKKAVKKKDQKGAWHELGSVSIYDGIGLKGELEIYFKALEDTKSRIDRLQKVKESIDSLVSRGVKKDLACTTFLGRDMLLDMAFTKSSAPQTKFTFKSTFHVEAEHPAEIMI
jgi:hypothetical protein